MAVDDKKVLALIDHYQGQTMNMSDPLERNKVAFRSIQAFRNAKGGSTDESLAAAEHYLFARFMVSNGGAGHAQMKALVGGYDALKFVAQLSDRTEKLMRHNPANPTSKVSAASIAWGLKGCDDGEEDRKKYAAHKPEAHWNWGAIKFNGWTQMVADAGERTIGGY